MSTSALVYLSALLHRFSKNRRILVQEHKRKAQRFLASESPFATWLHSESYSHREPNVAIHTLCSIVHHAADKAKASRVCMEGSFEPFS